MSSGPAGPKIILKTQGQVMIEDIPDLVLCKPRLIPLKSFTLEKLEKMQRDSQTTQKQQSRSDNS